MVTDNSGNTYRTIIIGGREWFAENLRTSTYSNGNTIPQVSSITPDENLLMYNGAWSYYGDSSALNCSRGKLYNFYTVVDERGLCPSGFRVASFYDWEQLIQSIGGASNGLNLMETGSSHWANSNPGATNSTGFTAVPAGVIDGNGDLGQLDTETYWWTASFGTNTINQYTSQNFFTKRLGSSNGYLYTLGDPNLRNLQSIRCVRTDTSVNHKPVLSPLVIDSVGLYSVRINSDISNDGGLPIRMRGIVVGTDSTVTLNTSFRTMDGSIIGPDATIINDLEPNTTYYARLYAGNDDEIVFGEPVQFTTETVQISLPSYIPASGNKGYWPFNGNADDESGNERHGTVYGPQLTADRFGNPSSAYQFGSSEYIATSLTHLSSPTLTIAAWAKTSSSQMEMTLTSARGGSITGLYYNANQVVGTFGNSGGGFHNGDYSNSPSNDGNWHHVAMSYNDTTIRIYFDGAVVVDAPISFDLYFNGPFEFGRDNPYGRYFYGDLDDIGLWDRALSTEEVYQLFQAQCSLNVSLNAGSATPYCQGDTVALVASTNGISQYEWSRDGQFILATTDSVFNATQSGTYSVKALSGVCLAYDTLTISINSFPPVNAGSDQNLCTGSSIILTGSGATTYTWDNGVQNGVAFTPASTGSYVLTGTDANGCANNDTLLVTVNMLPLVNAGSDQIVCMGSSVTISANGATTYTWDNGVQNGIPFIASVSTNYVVSGTDANGCSNTDNVLVTVSMLPTVNAGPDQTICIGSGVTLSGSGALNYVWNNSVNDGIAFSPSTTEIYTVTGTSTEGCTSSDQVIITVHLLPTVFAGNDLSVCEGASITLTGSGAATYTWDNGVQNGIPFIASVSSNYVVSGTDANGCSNTDTVMITTNPLPSVNAGTDQVVCQGSSVTLSGNSTVPSSWDNGIQDGVAFVPSSSTNYIFTGTDANGCVNSDYVLVTVNMLPTVDAGYDQNICIGSPTTLTGNGATTYTWDNGVQDGVPFIPSAMISVIVSGTDLNGCTNQDTVDINVADFTSPFVSTSPSDPGSCNGTGTIQTDPSGSFSISWSNGFDGSVVNGLCAGVVSVVVAETTFGCVYEAYELVEENGTSYPLSTQISLNDASVDGLCDGAAEFFAYGGISPYTYEIFDANYSLIGSNPSISGLCSGLYKIYISDSQGTVDSTSFYIADPGNVYSSDPYADSSIIDTLFVDLLEDCVIDFETIDTVWVSQITYPNADMAIVTWAIQDINGIHYIDRGYAITNLLGTFAVELVLFCPGKAPGDPFFKLYSQVYINAQTLNSGGEISSSGRIILFPNPADDLITLLMDEARHEMYILSDSQGRTVLKGWLSGTQTQISMRELKPGTYGLQIGDDKMPIRVIKQ